MSNIINAVITVSVQGLASVNYDLPGFVADYLDLDDGFKISNCYSYPDLINYGSGSLKLTNCLDASDILWYV